MDYKIIDISTRATESEGSLSFFEELRDFDFAIKRVYYVYDVDRGIWRGGHAHKQLWQMLFCPYGKIEVCLDDSEQKDKIMLDCPSKGLVIGPGLWRDILWHQDKSVLCVAASEYYDARDYIRDYQEFLEFKKGTENG